MTSTVFEHIFFKAFSPSRRGRLVVDLPDGRRWIFGKGREIEASIVVREGGFFRRCVLFGSVGFGEAYTAGEWDSDDLTAVIAWMILNIEQHPTLDSEGQPWRPVNLLGTVNRMIHGLRPNTRRGSRRNIFAHYDLGNDFFRLFLDSGMTYSCADFTDQDDSLFAAQTRKYESLCRKLRLKPRDHLLEIGSGWGGMAVYAAKRYGCRVTTVTISREQYAYAGELIRREGLGDTVDLRLMDYRDITGTYSKIVSIEMIEAVGAKNYPVYFRKLHDLLAPDGIAALQMILSADHRFEGMKKRVDWIQKHIFPGSLLPSWAAVQREMNRAGRLNLFDYSDMTSFYAKTLAVWRDNFLYNLDSVKSLGLDETFIRKWLYYLAYCEAAFDRRHIFVAQAVLARPNTKEVDTPARPLSPGGNIEYDAARLD